MTKQGYDYLDRTIKEISGFIKTQLDNLEVPAPAIQKPSKKKEKKKTSQNKKLYPLRILTKNP